MYERGDKTHGKKWVGGNIGSDGKKIHPKQFIKYGYGKCESHVPGAQPPEDADCYGAIKKA